LPVEWKLGDSDGHWLAYSSEVTGRMEVYVRPFADQCFRQWDRSADAADAGAELDGGW